MLPLRAGIAALDAMSKRRGAPPVAKVGFVGTPLLLVLICASSTFADDAASLNLTKLKGPIGNHSHAWLHPDGKHVSLQYNSSHWDTDSIILLDDHREIDAVECEPHSLRIHVHDVDQMEPLIQPGVVLTGTVATATAGGSQRRVWNCSTRTFHRRVLSTPEWRPDGWATISTESVSPLSLFRDLELDFATNLLAPAAAVLEPEASNDSMNESAAGSIDQVARKERRRLSLLGGIRTFAMRTFATVKTLASEIEQMSERVLTSGNLFSVFDGDYHATWPASRWSVNYACSATTSSSTNLAGGRRLQSCPRVPIAAKATPTSGEHTLVMPFGGASCTYSYIMRGSSPVVTQATCAITSSDIRPHRTCDGVTDDNTRDYARSFQPECTGGSGSKGDDAGHILGSQLGGCGKCKMNIFPQTPSVNKGRFRVFEDKIRSCFDSDGATRANLSWTFTHNGEQARPDRIFYAATFDVGCAPKSQWFDNPCIRTSSQPPGAPYSSTPPAPPPVSQAAGRLDLEAGIACTNCYIHAGADVTLRVRISSGLVQTVEIIASGDAEARVEIQIDGNAQLHHERYSDRIVPRLNFNLPTFMIGPVPVTLELIVTTRIGYEFDSHASAAITVGAAAHGSLMFGLTYQRDRSPALQTVGKADWGHTGLLTQFEGSASANLQVYLQPAALLRLEHIGGPVLGMKAWTEAAAEAAGTVTVQSSGESTAGCAAVSAGMGLQLTISGVIDCFGLRRNTPTVAIFSKKWPIASGQVCAQGGFPAPDWWPNSGGSSQASSHSPPAHAPLAIAPPGMHTSRPAPAPPFQVGDGCTIYGGNPGWAPYCQSGEAFVSSRCSTGCAAMAQDMSICCSSQCCPMSESPPPGPPPRPSHPPHIASPCNELSERACRSTSIECGWCISYVAALGDRVGGSPTTAGDCIARDANGGASSVCEVSFSPNYCCAPGQMDSTSTMNGCVPQPCNNPYDAPVQNGIVVETGYRVGTTWVGNLQRVGHASDCDGVPDFVSLTMQVVDVYRSIGSMDLMVSINSVQGSRVPLSDGQTVQAISAAVEQELWTADYSYGVMRITKSGTLTNADYSGGTAGATVWTTSRWISFDVAPSMQTLDLSDSLRCTRVHLSRSSASESPSPPPIPFSVPEPRPSLPAPLSPSVASPPSISTRPSGPMTPPQSPVSGRHVSSPPPPAGMNATMSSSPSLPSPADVSSPPPPAGMNATMSSSHSLPLPVDMNATTSDQAAQKAHLPSESVITAASIVIVLFGLVLLIGAIYRFRKRQWYFRPPDPTLLTPSREASSLASSDSTPSLSDSADPRHAKHENSAIESVAL